MAHFAEIDSNNKVIRVLVVDNQYETNGADYLAIKCGLGGRWIQTSYNRNFRGAFAAEGYFYDEEADEFIEPKAEEQEGYVAEILEVENDELEAK